MMTHTKNTNAGEDNMDNAHTSNLIDITDMTAAELDALLDTAAGDDTDDDDTDTDADRPAGLTDRVWAAIVASKADPTLCIEVDHWSRIERTQLASYYGWKLTDPVTTDWIWGSDRDTDTGPDYEKMILARQDREDWGY